MKKQIFHAGDHADQEVEIETLPDGGLAVFIYSARQPEPRSIELDAEQVADLYEQLGFWMRGE